MFLELELVKCLDFNRSFSQKLSVRSGIRTHACLFLALNLTSCYENWPRRTHHLLVEHFNHRWDKKKGRTSLEQIKTFLCGYLTRGNRHFTVLNANIWRTLHKKVQRGILLLQRKTRSHAQLFWICESGLCFCGKSRQFDSQIFVKVELHELLARVKANMWAPELERIAIFWCEKSQNMPGVWFEATPPLGDKNTLILPPLLSLYQLMTLI